MGAGGDIYSNEEADDLSKNYGLDIEDQLSSILSEEIDREILRGLGIEPDINKRRKNSINKIFKKSLKRV